MSIPSLTTTTIATESECAPSDSNIGWVVIVALQKCWRRGEWSKLIPLLPHRPNFPNWRAHGVPSIICNNCSKKNSGIYLQDANDT